MLRRVLVVGLAGVVLLGVPGFARTARSRFAVPGQMRVVAYYPAANGWIYMWDHWQPQQIDRDFGLIQGLNANTVRIFVQPRSFGFPNVTAAAASKLATVFSLAAKHGLAVELTLFDWWFDYGQVASSEQWVKQLLAPYAGDSRLAAVELRNELDPNGGGAVTWAKALIPYLRTVVPGVPITLSVSANDPLRKLAALSSALAPVAPDFWSLHYYDKPEYAYGVIAAARAEVAPVPLIVGETGYQPNLSSPAPRTTVEAEAERDRYFKTLMNATALLGMPPAGVWVLLDFTATASPQRMPAAQYKFGLFETNGTPKPAAGVVRTAYATPGEIDGTFDGDFEQAGLGSWRTFGSGTATRDTSIVHGGSGSGEITGGAQLMQIPPVPWASTATVSAWARGVGARIAIDWFDSNRLEIGETISAALSGTGWTQLSVHGGAPPGATYFEIVLSSTSTTAVRFDDVSLTQT